MNGVGAECWVSGGDGARWRRQTELECGVELRDEATGVRCGSFPCDSACDVTCAARRRLHRPGHLIAKTGIVFPYPLVKRRCVRAVERDPGVRCGRNGLPHACRRRGGRRLGDRKDQDKKHCFYLSDRAAILGPVLPELESISIRIRTKPYIGNQAWYV